MYVLPLIQSHIETNIKVTNRGSKLLESILMRKLKRHLSFPKISSKAVDSHIGTKPEGVNVIIAILTK